MARKRTGEIVESVEELERLEAKYIGKPQQLRVKAIRLLKEYSEIKMDEVAQQIGCSHATVKRLWRTYRKGGMEGVINIGRRVPVALTDNAGVVRLGQRIMAGDFKSLADVYAWLVAQGVPGDCRMVDSVSTQGVYGDRSCTGDAKEFLSSDRDFTTSKNLSVEAILTFFRSVIPSHSIGLWSESFRQALLLLLGDVDHISLSVNVHCDVLYPEKNNPGVVVSQSISSNINIVDLLSDATSGGDLGYADRFIEHLHRKRFPKNKFHQPIHIVYYIDNRAYLGVIVLWRSIRNSPISLTTVALMQRMQQVIVCLLSDFVLRHQLSNKAGATSPDSLDARIEL